MFDQNNMSDFKKAHCISRLKSRVLVRQKINSENNNSEAIWVVGVLCAIVLVVVLAFSVRRRTELVQANQKIESLTMENQSLTDANKKLQEEINTLQGKLDQAEEEAAEAKEKAKAYDDVQDQVKQFSQELQNLFSNVEGTQKGA